MREVGYDSAFMFKYSERPGTYASKHLPDDVPEEVKLRRLAEMIDLQTKLSALSNAKDVGHEFDVLVEGYRGSGNIPTVEIMRSTNERDSVAAAEFVRAVRQTGRLEYDDANLGRDAGRMPDELTVAVVSDIPEVHDAAQAVGLVTFGLDDEEAIADYIATHIARSGR